MIRQAISTATELVKKIGICVADHTAARMIRIHFAGKRPITNSPTAMPDSEKSRKKLLPINPNSFGDSDNSFIIGTADRPNTSLSKKFSVWNRNSMMSTASARPALLGSAGRACNGVIGVSPITDGGSLQPRGQLRQPRGG